MQDFALLKHERFHPYVSIPDDIFANLICRLFSELFHKYNGKVSFFLMSKIKRFIVFDRSLNLRDRLGPKHAASENQLDERFEFGIL